MIFHLRMNKHHGSEEVFQPPMEDLVSDGYLQPVPSEKTGC